MLDSHTRGQPARRPRAGHRRRRDPQADRASSARCYVSERRAAATPSRSPRPPAAPTSCGSAPRRARRCTWSAPPRRRPRSHGRDYVLPDDVHDAGAAGARAPAAAQRRGRDERARSTASILDGLRRAGAGPPGAEGTTCVRPSPALTVRGRAFLAAGRHRDRLRGPARPARPDPGRRAGARAAAGHRRCFAGPQPLPARAWSARVTPQLVAAGQPARVQLDADQRGPDADRRAAARGPRPLRARHPAPVRARADRPRLAPRSVDLPGALRRPRPLRDRPDDACGSATRSAWSSSAAPFRTTVAADRHPAHRAAAADPARRRLDRLRRQPAARVRRSAAPRTSRSASTAAATTCAGCTGAARRASAS